MLCISSHVSIQSKFTLIDNSLGHKEHLEFLCTKHLPSCNARVMHPLCFAGNCAVYLDQSDHVVIRKENLGLHIFNCGSHSGQRQKQILRKCGGQLLIIKFRPLPRCRESLSSLVLHLSVLNSKSDDQSLALSKSTSSSSFELLQVSTNKCFHLCASASAATCV